MVRTLKVIALSTFLSGAVLALYFQKANTGCLVLDITRILPRVSQHLGKSHFHVVLRRYQAEIPEK